MLNPASTKRALPRKVLLTCAVNGNAPLNPRYPFTYPVSPEQICQAVVEAAKAGASICHIHVRDLVTGAGCRRIELFKEVVDRIRQTGTDIVINLTAGGGGDFYPDPQNEGRALAHSDIAGADERVEHLRQCLPEMASLDVTTANQMDGDRDFVYLNTPRTLRRMAERFKQLGVKPEMEAFSPGDVLFANQLVEEGLIAGPPMYQFVLGVRWCTPASSESLIYMRSLLPSQAVWAAFGIGMLQFPMAAQSLLLGGNVRVGLEDNLYLSRGKFATNPQLVERAVRIITDLGYDVASPGDTRNILGLTAFERVSSQSVQ